MWIPRALINSRPHFVQDLLRLLKVVSIFSVLGGFLGSGEAPAPIWIIRIAAHPIVVGAIALGFVEVTARVLTILVDVTRTVRLAGAEEESNDETGESDEKIAHTCLHATRRLILRITM